MKIVKDFEKRSLIRIIDGEGSKADVFKRIIELFEKENLA
jgi:hypothetical protein